MPLVFSKDLLFVHLPKTGGTSVTAYLLDVLPPPVWYQSPHRRRNDVAGIHHLTGVKHASLAAAVPVVAEHGFALASFPLILAVVRNPYEVAVSEYEFWRSSRRGEDASAARAKQQAIQELTFPEFIRASLRPGPLRSRTFEEMLCVDGRLPPNLRLVRYESLAEGVRDALRSVGIACDAPFPWRNRSEHGAWPTYYDAATASLVERAQHWVFEKGLYPRLA